MVFLLPFRAREGLGVGLREHGRNARQHAFRIPYHVGILKAQDGKALSAAISGALRIIFSAVACLV